MRFEFMDYTVHSRTTSAVGYYVQFENSAAPTALTNQRLEEFTELGQQVSLVDFCHRYPNTNLWLGFNGCHMIQRQYS